VEQAGSESLRHASRLVRNNLGVVYAGRLADLGCKSMPAVEGGGGDDESVAWCPMALWPHVLAKAMLIRGVFYYLKNKHELFEFQSSESSL